MKYALIGNCAFQALLDERARVTWLCWPRFDSSFVFGSLLDEERGGDFSVEPAEAEFETRQSYIKNTNVLRTEFHTPSGVFEVVDFAPRFRQYERYYKPATLMRRVRPLSGEPSVRVRCRPVYDYGRLAPRRHVASNHIQWEMPETTLRLTTDVPLTYVSEGRPFLLERDACLALTWGAHLEAPLAPTLETFLSQTRRYWERWVKHTTVPGCFQAEVIRSALALKLHQYEDTGAITAATTTSLPEADGTGRNWDYRFCWLRDSYFTLRAMRRLGQFEETEGFESWLKNIAQASPDRLQPVYGISGESELTEVTLDHLSGYRNNRPVRAGNEAYAQVQNDVYGEMIAAMSPLLLDIRFSERLGQGTDRLIHRLLDRVAETMEIPDAGIWEYREKELVSTFSLLMHWTGATMAKRIAERLPDDKLRKRAEEQAARAHKLIESCWDEELGYYVDSTSTRNPDAALFMMINLGYLKPSDPRAERHLRGLASELAVADPLMHRYKHDDGFEQHGCTFTVCGFWYTEALARLGHKDQAQEACKRLTEYANHVGLFSEDLDPKTGEQWGNFPQTYSHVGLINTAFAIRPVPEEDS